MQHAKHGGKGKAAKKTAKGGMMPMTGKPMKKAHEGMMGESGKTHKKSC